MAGILANSSTKTMVSGDAAVDNTTSGFIALERVTLSTTGTPTSYAWGLAKPSDSTSSCALSSDTAASPTFSPDVQGYYTITCVVDGVTTYILRVAVLSIAAGSTLSTIRFLPIADSQVPTPATGSTVYWSSTQGALAEKLSTGAVKVITVV